MHFDSTQKINGMAWMALQQAGPPYSRFYNEPFPTFEEDANDDLPQAVESDKVTSANHFYFYDRPGTRPGQIPGGFELIFRANFLTWLRVGINETPSDVGVHGSRVSDYNTWFARVHAVQGNNFSWRWSVAGDNTNGSGWEEPLEDPPVNP